MKRAWLVASYEFGTNIRKRSFLLAVFGLPVLMLGLFAIITFASLLAFSGGDIKGERVGYVDETGLSLFVPPVEEPEGFLLVADAGTARAQLEAGDLEGYFVVGQAYITSGSIAFYGSGSLPDALEDTFEAFLVRNVVARTDSDLPETLLETPANLTVYLENTGRTVSRDAFAALLIIPLIFVMLFMLALQFSSAFLMSSVVEEKTNRVMEILITSVTPTELLSGKVLGLGALGLVQIGAWLVFGIVGFLLFQNVEFLQGVTFPLDLFALASAYFFLSYFFYSSLLAGVGAISDSEQESRQYAGLITFGLALPFFFIAQAFIAPDTDPILRFLSYFPFSSGIAMLLRATFGAPTIAEIALSLGVLVVSTVFVMWASAKVFRWGILLYGKKFSLRALWQVVRGRVDAGYIAPSQKS